MQPANITQTIDINTINDIAKQAGAAILEIYQQDFDVYTKEDSSPLTEADLAAHNIIVDALQKLTPEIPVLSEESTKIPFETRSSWNRYWLIDPLDGTREFVNKNGEFTVNIALIDNHKPVMGVVYVPVTETTYFGTVGEGAFVERDGEISEISASSKAHTPLRVAGSRSHAGESLKRFLAEVGAHQMLSMGSSLKLCLVAEGKADIYPRIGPTSEWDTGAAQAVVEAAGGMVTETNGEPLRYNCKDSLLNPYFLVFGDSSREWHKYFS
jgi:3'(2'), 5'-bisphosphate nucleotidase